MFPASGSGNFMAFLRYSSLMLYSDWVVSFPSSFVKLNIDGSSFGNLGRVRFGGLLRDSQGVWIADFFSFDGHVDSLCAKLLVLCRGLCLSWDAGYHLIICKVECLEILCLVQVVEVEFSSCI